MTDSADFGEQPEWQELFNEIERTIRSNTNAASESIVNQIEPKFPGFSSQQILEAVQYRLFELSTSQSTSDSNQDWGETEFEMVPTWLGRYQRFEEINAGGFGRVFRAQDSEVLSRAVAIKVIRPDRISSQNEIRFFNEMLIAGNLHHSNIVPVFDAGEASMSDSGTRFYYYVMEYVTGKTVDDEIRRKRVDLGLVETIKEGPLTVPTHQISNRSMVRRTEQEIQSLIDQMLEVAAALHYFHVNPLGKVVHNDVKPANILINVSDNRMRLIDFGGAWSNNEEVRNVEHVGTAAYISPEARQGTRDDVKNDIFSFGATLYTLLTLESPYAEPVDWETVVKFHQTDRQDWLILPSKICHNISASLDQIILKSMAPDPARRYQSIQDLAEDLRRFQNKLPPKHAKQAKVLERFRLFRKRNPSVVPFAASVFLLLLFWGITWFVLYIGQSTARLAESEAHKATLLAKEEADQAFSVLLNTNISIADLPELIEQYAGSEARVVREILQLSETSFSKLIDEVGPRPDVLAVKARMLNKSIGLFVRLSDANSAKAAALESLEICKQIEGEIDETEYQFIFAESQLANGLAQRLEGYLQISRQSIERAIEWIDEIPSEFTKENLKVMELRAECLNHLAMTVDAQGDKPRAKRLFAQVFRTYRRLVESDESNQRWRWRLSGCYRRLSDRLLKDEQVAAAVTAAEKSVELCRTVLEYDPGHPIWNEYVIQSLTSLGSAKHQQADIDGALEAYQEGARIADEQLRADPENDFLRSLRHLLSLHVQDLRREGSMAEQLREQIAAAQDQIESLEELKAQNEDNLPLSAQVAAVHMMNSIRHLGLGFADKTNLRAQLDSFRKARAGFKKVMDLQRFYDRDDTNLSVIQLICGAKWSSAMMKFPRISQKEFEQAVQPQIDALRKRIVAEPDNVFWKYMLAKSLDQLASVYRILKDFDKADQCYLESAKFYETAVSDGEASAEIRYSHVTSELAQARALYLRDKLKECDQKRTSAIESLKKLCDENRHRNSWKRELAEHLGDQALRFSDQPHVALDLQLERLNLRHQVLMATKSDPFRPPLETQGSLNLSVTSIASLASNATQLRAQIEHVHQLVKPDEGLPKHLIVEQILLLVELMQELDVMEPFRKSGSASQNAMVERHFLLRELLFFIQLAENEGVSHPFLDLLKERASTLLMNPEMHLSATALPKKVIEVIVSNPADPLAIAERIAQEESIQSAAKWLIADWESGSRLKIVPSRNRLTDSATAHSGFARKILQHLESSNGQTEKAFSQELEKILKK